MDNVTPLFKNANKEQNTVFANCAQILYANADRTYCHGWIGSVRQEDLIAVGGERSIRATYRQENLFEWLPEILKAVAAWPDRKIDAAGLELIGQLMAHCVFQMRHQLTNAGLTEGHIDFTIIEHLNRSIVTLTVKQWLGTEESASAFDFQLVGQFFVMQ